MTNMSHQLSSLWLCLLCLLPAATLAQQQGGAPPTGVPDPFAAFDRAFDRAFSRVFSGPPGFGPLMLPSLMAGPGVPGTQAASEAGLFPPMGVVAGAWHVPMDIVEKDHTYELIADAPGMSPDEVKIEVLDNVLTISGEHKEKKEEKDKEGKVVRSERFVRRFHRSFTLPETANQDAIAAHLDKGVLRVTVPKMPAPEKPQPKRISVSAAGGSHGVMDSATTASSVSQGGDAGGTGSGVNEEGAGAAAAEGEL